MGGLDHHELIGEAMGHGPWPFWKKGFRNAFSQHPLHSAGWGWVTAARVLRAKLQEKMWRAPCIGVSPGCSGELQFST